MTQGFYLNNNNKAPRKNGGIMKLLNLSVDYHTLSHELRTPLVGILGITELMQDEALTAFQKDQLNCIRQAGVRLLEVINKILNSPRSDVNEATDFLLIGLHNDQNNF